MIEVLVTAVIVILLGLAVATALVTQAQASGDEGRALLKATLWHQTRTGATIYHRRVRDWVVEQGDALIVKPDFPQISVMLGYASHHDATLGWFGQPSLGVEQQESYWQKQASGRGYGDVHRIREVIDWDFGALTERASDPCCCEYAPQGASFAEISRANRSRLSS